jgi:hypothetical protein
MTPRRPVRVVARTTPTRDSVNTVATSFGSPLPPCKALALACVLVVASSVLHGQRMPDPSQMAGRPLPAPELVTGMVSVRLVRERMGNNIANHPVILRAGERTLNATTDAQGRAQFGDVPPGTQITVEAVVEGETLRSQEFAVPVSGGVRVALIAGLEAAAARERAAAEEAARQPARPGVVVLGGETRIILEFQDDNLQVFYLLDIVNNARSPIDIGSPMYLDFPDGATGAGAMNGSSPLAVVQGDRLRINGPFPPGTTQVQVGYRYPYSGSSATLTQRWPAAIEQLFVAAEKVGDVRIASPQFSQQQDATAGGAPFLMATGPRLNAGDTLTITLSGLPHRNTLMRDVGLVAGTLLLLVGLWAGFRRGPDRVDQTAELTKRRERLYAELVTLETHRKQGRVDERRYVARRQSLVSQLERVLGELDGGPAGSGEGAAA